MENLKKIAGIVFCFSTIPLLIIRGWFAKVVCERSFAFPLWSYQVVTKAVGKVPTGNVPNVIPGIP